MRWVGWVVEVAVVGQYGVCLVLGGQLAAGGRWLHEMQRLKLVEGQIAELMHAQDISARATDAQRMHVEHITRPLALCLQICAHTRIVEHSLKSEQTTNLHQRT